MAKFKNFWIFLLTALLLIMLITTIAFATTKNQATQPKAKNPQQELGNKWEIKNAQVRPKGIQIHPKKDLKYTAEENNKAKEARAKRLHPTKKDKTNK